MLRHSPGALFNVVLVAHLLAAMLWLGGGAMLGLLAFAGRGRTDLSVQVEDLRRAGRLRAWCFMPASAVLLGCGLALVALGHLSLRMLWLDIALGGWFVAFTLSSGCLVPKSAELVQAASAKRSDHQLRRQVRQLRVLGIIETAVLVLVLVDMVLRPI